MDVRPGYKQSEVGVIPEDWTVKSLGSVLRAGRLGGNYQNQDRETSKPLMKMGNIARGSFDLGKVEYVPESVAVEPAHRLRAGDLLFNTRNTLELVGKVAIWRDELPLAYYNSNLMRLEFDSAEICSNAFANYALNARPCIDGLRALATGTTSVAAIYTRDLLRLPLSIPPKAEQRAIAAALSDVDALLARLDQLIAKKRDLKQAAMQQLLTGPTRLPGFTDEWEVRTLLSLLTQPATYGIVKAGLFQPDGIPMVRGGDIKNGQIASDLPFVTAGKSQEYSRTVVQATDVLIALVGYPGESAKVPPSLAGANISRAVGLLRPSRMISPDYLVCYLNSPVGRKNFLTPSAGSAQLVVNLKDLNLLRIPLPGLPEQDAIAGVLSDMDAEIAALEARLAKASALKQGMMQELLTGKTRLG